MSTQTFSELVGTEITHFEPDRTVLRIALRKDHRQQHGLVHGGAIAYAADNVMAFGAGTVLGASVVSAGFAITFLAPARGAELVATAVLVTATARLAIVRCEVVVLDEAGVGTMCAAAQGTLVIRGAELPGSADAAR